MLGPQITFGEWFHNKRNIYFSLKDLLRIKLKLFYGKFSYSVSVTGSPVNNHLSSPHQNFSVLTWNTNVVAGVVLCLWSVANASQQEKVLVYVTQVKSTELRSAAFFFAGKGNNYSICFASKMGRASVFLTSLRGKKITPSMVKVHPFLPSSITTLQFIFFLAATFFSLMWFTLERCLMH